MLRPEQELSVEIGLLYEIIVMYVKIITCICWGLNKNCLLRLDFSMRSLSVIVCKDYYLYMLRPEQELPVEIGLLYEIIVSDSM